jgi:serine/threonine protein kinase
MANSHVLYPLDYDDALRSKAYLAPGTTSAIQRAITIKKMLQAESNEQQEGKESLSLPRATRLKKSYLNEYLFKKHATLFSSTDTNHNSLSYILYRGTKENPHEDNLWTVERGFHKNGRFQNRFKAMRLGQGFYGVTKLARHVETGQIKVLKVLLSLQKQTRCLDAYWRARKDFMLEKETLDFLGISFEDMLSKLGVRDGKSVELDQDSMAFMMNYYPGKTLETILQEGITREQQLNIAIKLAEAVQAMHQKGIIHRDLKVDNFLYDAEANQVHIIDYGFALTKQNRQVKFGCLSKEDKTSAIAALKWFPISQLDLLLKKEEEDIRREFLEMIEILFKQHPKEGDETFAYDPSKKIIYLKTKTQYFKIRIFVNEERFVGAKGYRAPEINYFDPPKCSEKSDVYSLGRVFQELFGVIDVYEDSLVKKCFGQLLKLVGPSLIMHGHIEMSTILGMLAENRYERKNLEETIRDLYWIAGEEKISITPTVLPSSSSSSSLQENTIQANGEKSRRLSC